MIPYPNPTWDWAETIGMYWLKYAVLHTIAKTCSNGYSKLMAYAKYN